MASKTYTTVNGIKTHPIDEATRKKIERAGNTEDQLRKAAELNVLDHNYYKRIAQILKYIANDFW